MYPISCFLLDGLSPSEKEAALRLLKARTERFSKGALLNRPGERLNAFGLVQKGCVQVTCYDFNGLPMIMATVEPGETFGESLYYLRREANIYILASAPDTEVLWLETPDLLSSPDGDGLPALLSRRFIAMLASRSLQMNDRIQVLSKHSLREKILTFLSQYAARIGRDEFEVPMDRERMAVYLGCERSALSRELSRLQKEGILSFRKNGFSLHKPVRS